MTFLYFVFSMAFSGDGGGHATFSGLGGCIRTILVRLFGKAECAAAVATNAADTAADDKLNSLVLGSSAVT